METKELPFMKQWHELKEKHPDAILLFRCGDYYEVYGRDARTCGDLLGIKVRHFDEDATMYAGFPYFELDVYLPKLIRAGKRVAIVDELNPPPPKRKHDDDETNESDNNNNNSKSSTTMATKKINSQNESVNVQTAAQVENQVEDVNVGEVTLATIMPKMTAVPEEDVTQKSQKSQKEPTAPEKPVNTGRTKIVVAGVPKPGETGDKPKPTMPKRDASGKFLKKGATEEPKTEAAPKAEGKYQYVTYEVKKVNKTTKKEYTVTGSKIVGFELTDPIYLGGPAFCGAISTEKVGDKTVGALRFSHKWTPAVKDVCDLLNGGNATLEGCVAIINGAKTERYERIQNRIAKREERKAKKAQEQGTEAEAQAEPAAPAAPAMSNEEQAMFELFKKFLKGDKAAMAQVNEVLKAA